MEGALCCWTNESPTALDHACAVSMLQAVLCATTEAWLRMENHLTGVLNETQDVLLAKQSSYKISVISDEFV